MAKRIQVIFNILPGEGRMVALVLIYAILLYFSNVMARTASMALFLSEYGADTLPYTYLFLMFIGPLVSLIYLRLNNRFSLGRVLLGIHIFLLISLVVLPLILNLSTAPWLLFALPIYFGVNNSLTISSFWNLLGRIYNLRQGKRLFALLSSGEHMATIVAGFMAPLFVAWIGTTNLYWIGAIFMLVTVIMLFAINRANASKMGVVTTGKTEKAGQPGIFDLLKESYVRLIFALFTLFIVGIYMVGNINYAQAEIRFPTADGMATYVGVFMGIFGVLSLFVQWVIAGRVLDRFGVRAMIMATPTGLFVFMLIFALVGTFSSWTSALFWLAAAASMWQAILDAVDSTAINVLYQPLPAQLRTQAQTSVIGIVYPLAIGLSGLLLIFLYDVLGFDSIQLSYVVLIVIVIWIIVGLRLGRAYPRRLRQALQTRSLGSLTLARPDRASISVFENALSSPHPAAVLYALDMLEEVAPQKAAEHLPELLVYPDDQVRIAALERVSQQPWPEAADGITRLLDESPNPAVRAAALQAWNDVDAQSAALRLSDYCRDQDAQVRLAALTMMRLHADPALSEQAAAMLKQLATSSAADERLLAATVIGQTALDEDAPLLLKLLADHDLPVRRAALEAAASTRFPELWTAVIPALADVDTHTLAVTALAAGGEETIAALQAACVNPDLHPQVVTGIDSVLGRLGGPQAIAILESHIDHPQRRIRHQALASLSRCGYHAEDGQREFIEQQLRSTVSRTTGIIAAQVDVGDQEEVLLLASALDQSRQLETDNLYLLLSFLYDSQTVLMAREVLRSDSFDDEKTAYATEALDILVDHKHKALLFPFFQELDAEERWAAVTKNNAQELLGRENRLLVLVNGQGDLGDRLIAICAIYSLGLLESAGAAEAVSNTAEQFSSDSLLVETACWTLEQLGQTVDGVSERYPHLGTALSSWQTRDPQARGTRALIRLQKVELLKQAELFNRLPYDVLLAIVELTVDLSLPKDELLMRSGDQGECMYIVGDGQLHVHEGSNIYDTIGRGSVVGEMALLDAQPRSASVSAAADSHLIQLEQQPFFDLLSKQPQVARGLMGLLAQRLRERTADVAAGIGETAARPVMPMVGGQPGLAGSMAAQEPLMDLDKVFILQGVELFGQLDNDLLEQIAVLVDDVDLSGGEELFHQGDAGSSLYIIAAGQVRVHIEEHTLTYRGEGEVIGEMALLQAEPRSATVTAASPTHLLRLDQEPFFELLEAQPEMALGIMRMLSGRLRSLLQVLKE